MLGLSHGLRTLSVTFIVLDRLDIFCKNLAKVEVRERRNSEASSVPSQGLRRVAVIGRESKVFKKLFSV